MKRLEGLMRRAIQEYDMIRPGDRVCVGVSGGKDSLALTIGLARLREYIGIPFEVIAVSLDPQFGGKPTDYSRLEELFSSYNVPFHVVRSNIGHVVFDVRKEPNPCALCAKMRRGLLHTTAQELGCNRVALGHHLDDAVETFYMNLWGEGRLGCFSPVSWLSRRELYLIRPMILATENQVQTAAASLSLPVVKSPCPVDGRTKRQDTKDFVTDMCAQDPAFRQKMLGALRGADLDGWGPGSDPMGRSK